MAVAHENKHANNLIDNIKEVDRLKEIHSQITPGGPGRKRDVEVLHKSAIVLLVACWEAFVEDMATESLQYMISEAKSPSVLPKNVLERVASRKAGISAWELAGTGWKKALRDNLTEVLARTTGTLNTPRTAQVDELFEKAIGLPSISSSWYWSGRSVESAAASLDRLVTLRGSIAHRVSAAQAVELKYVDRARQFIYRLVVKSHNCVCRFLESTVERSPWTRLRFGATR